MSTSLRRDRLLNLLHRGATTVPVVAESLQVSERTIYRDISALRDAGHRIQATPGPGGGVRVAPDSRPRPVYFQLSEIIGLALSVAILQATPNQPFARSAQAALDRARRALSSDRQRALRRMEGRIIIGPPATERTRQSLGQVDDTLLSVFERCFTGGQTMNLDYVDRFGEPSSRRIECVALVLHAPLWYVLAWDLDKDAPRMFRMDRIACPQAGLTLERTHELKEVLSQARPDTEFQYGRWLGTPIG